MSKVTVRREVANGQWKFVEPAVPTGEVHKFAEELRDGPEGAYYERLEVRRCGKKETGISFIFHHDGSAKEHQEYFHRMRQYLTGRFGEDNVHWDVSSSMDVVK